MAANEKRLDLRFGAFACSVQGFDDPVMPVQQVLRAIQHLLEESPEIADAGISFDAETIESLTEEVARRADVDTSDIEICPGLVIVYYGDGAPPDLERPPRAAATEATVQPGAGQGSEPGSERGSEPHGDVVFGTFDDENGRAAENAVSDRFTDRLRRSLIDAPAPPEDGGPVGDPDGNPAREAGGGASASPGAPEGTEAPPENLFAAGGPDDAGPAPDPDPQDDAAQAGGFNLFGNLNYGADYEVELPPEDGPFGDEPLAQEPLADNSFGDAPPVGDDGFEPAASAEEAPAAPGDAGAGGETYSLERICKLAGAEAVPDLIVAAAAYMVLMKGQTSFSRRDVLDMFDRIPGDHPKTLEARIKGFGKAVRNGQIMAIEEGLFGLSREEVDRFERLL